MSNIPENPLDQDLVLLVKSVGMALQRVDKELQVILPQLKAEGQVIQEELAPSINSLIQTLNAFCCKE
jgi:hypothetical protein